MTKGYRNSRTKNGIVYGPHPLNNGAVNDWLLSNGSLKSGGAMRLPTKEEFDAGEFALWSTFKILLMLLAMVAVVVAEAKHIWWGDRKKGRANRVAGCRMVGC